MPGLLTRIFRRLLALLAGALTGLFLGDLVGWPRFWMLLGVVAAGAVLFLRDAASARRLVQWVRDDSMAAAPRDTGFWGEIGYRVERALRAREREAARESERLRLFLDAIEASPNGVILLDAHDQIEWLNAAAASHFGLDPQRDLRQRATNLIRLPAFVAALQADEVDEPVVLADPRGRGALSVLVRPYGEGARLVLSQDITERERADAMRRDFVANVSHEIRTPLTVLAGFVETLQTLPLSEAERSRSLALMAQQTGRMQALVADLLTLAQLEGSPSPSIERWTPVGELLARAQADGAALSGGRHRLHTDDGADAEFAGNEAELLSAVSNLVNNAVRYTPPGGDIELRWRWRDDGGGVIEVTDNGIGIAREHLPRLTERFYRVDSSRSRDTGGTGLGLAIVKHVAQRHGGEIDVQSEPGQGSTFRLVLPPLRLRRRVAPAATSAITVLQETGAGR